MDERADAPHEQLVCQEHQQRCHEAAGEPGGQQLQPHAHTQMQQTMTKAVGTG